MRAQGQPCDASLRFAGFTGENIVAVLVKIRASKNNWTTSAEDNDYKSSGSFKSAVISIRTPENNLKRKIVCFDARTKKTKLSNFSMLL